MAVDRRLLSLLLPTLVPLVLLKTGLYGVFRQSENSVVFKSSQVAQDFTSLLAAQAENNEVVMTVTTNHYLKISLNLICSLKQNEIHNFVIGALDRQAYAELLSRQLPAFPTFALVAADGEDVQPGTYGSVEFNVVNLVKELTVIAALELGYQVLLVDSDIVFCGDPRQVIRETYSDYDFAFQSNSKLTANVATINGGMYYARPRNASITILNKVVELKRKDPTLKDQPAFRELLCMGPKRKSNISCHDPETGAKTIILDPLDYVVGNRFGVVNSSSSDYEPNSQPIVYHFTASGNTTNSKMTRIKEMKLWMLDKVDECLG